MLSINIKTQTKIKIKTYAIDKEKILNTNRNENSYKKNLFGLGLQILQLQELTNLVLNMRGWL